MLCPNTYRIGPIELTYVEPPKQIRGQLEKAITPKTRVLLINTPHNPCGHCYTKEVRLFVPAAQIDRCYACCVRRCDDSSREDGLLPTVGVLLLGLFQ